jgi:hypothetical protein
MLLMLDRPRSRLSTPKVQKKHPKGFKE